MTDQRTVSLAEIRQDSQHWPRHALDEEAVERYMDAADAVPPLVIDSEGFLVDGWHRLEAFRRLEEKEIKVEVITCEPHLRLAAAYRFNSQHGLPIGNERRDEIIKNLYTERHMTQEAIAEVMGLSQNRISEILGRLSATDNLPKETLRLAIRAYEAGATGREIEQRFNIPRRTFEGHFKLYSKRLSDIRAHLGRRGPLTSVLSYPSRGDWGDSKFRGNCPGYLLVDLFDFFKPTSVLDPMEGSGTAGDVAFDMGIDDYAGLDLEGAFDLVSDDLPDRRWDFIFWHPPYHDMIEYEIKHPNNLSTVSREEWGEKWPICFQKLADRLADNGHLAILIGDRRHSGDYRPLAADFAQAWPGHLLGILIKLQYAEASRRFDYGGAEFIPIKHEYVILFHA